MCFGRSASHFLSQWLLEASLKVLVRRWIHHRLSAGIAVSAFVDSRYTGVPCICWILLRVDWTAGNAGSVHMCLLHLTVSFLECWEAVMLAVQRGQEVQNKGQHVEDEDQADCPFDDGGSIVMIMIAEYAKSNNQGYFDENEC